MRVELRLIATRGVQNQQGPIGALGGQGVFTKEIQRALLDGEVDLAVHSLKDLPTDETPGLVLAAGHHRNGVLLSPATGELVRDGLLGKGWHEPAFLPERWLPPGGSRGG